MEIVDHRLVGALHVGLVDRAHAAAELAAGEERVGDAFQTSTIEALLDGAYEGDLTVGELLAHGDLGIGTVDHLDGELVVLDGEAWVVAASGAVRAVAPDEGTPFAVVCRFSPGPAVALGPCADLDAVGAAIEAASPPGATVLAVRIDGAVARARVRSVARQEPPYPPLTEVVSHQREWELVDVVGTVVGFRFPDGTDGLEVPGWHLHLLTEDRTAGGHLMALALSEGTLQVEATDALHVEVPDHVDAALHAHGRDRAAEIAAVEGRPHP
ncbi:acetolactate decarboxylase [Iamia majanohamensis]|uniref:Alpha-acetolactate decarboxylase n=1 Tax=Iamia majanohamensis TaxID=467976 RepID=A0AAF0BSV0_9ACTN|nr:acetolactate decarboxylase [Iamia majanohamensis]WCO68961.1 acetolactate decarboxylase [Iamia majanohamensis]